MKHATTKKPLNEKSRGQNHANIEPSSIDWANFTCSLLTAQAARKHTTKTFPQSRWARGRSPPCPTASPQALTQHRGFSALTFVLRQVSPLVTRLSFFHQAI